MIIITGSTGLIGYSASDYFLQKNIKVIGIDNNMRKYFFGKISSNKWVLNRLKKNNNYIHYSTDIRNQKKIYDIFKKYKNKIKAIIHTAAQPSHDWAVKEPHTDFSINATGTLNLLEAYRNFCPEASFIFTSTNKVYGDTPNYLPLIESKSRFEINKKHNFFQKGINETMSIDNTTHSLFGTSKLSADLMVQEYGRYFNLNTVCFRGGCLTGENHSGAELHGFLSFLVKSIMRDKKYYVFGYKGKQDEISTFRFTEDFNEFIKKYSSLHKDIHNIFDEHESWL